MAVATYTCSAFLFQPKQVHVGVNPMSASLMWTATSTVGDVAFLCKVPHGAIITDFSERHSTGATATALDFGFSKGVAAGGGGNASILISGGAQATRNTWTMAGGPIRISVSDLDPVRYAILIAKVASGSTTTSLFLENFSLSYRCDEIP